MKRSVVVALAALIGLGAVASAAAQPPPAAGRAGGAPPGRGGAEAQTNAQATHGEQVFSARCKSCHEPAIDRAPNRAALAGRWADEVIAALKTGMMQPMAAGMTDADITDVSVFLTGQQPGVKFDVAAESKNKCAASNRFNPKGPSYNGWSPSNSNNRIASSSTVTAAQAPKLKVKWSFAYQGGRYGEPTVIGNRVFITSSSGMNYALDRDTGCVAWSFSTAPAGVRVTVTAAPDPKAASGWAIYFGDYGKVVHALDANSGKELWKTKIDDHPRTVLTGAPVVYKDRLYVPVSSWEETVASLSAYECCTARGAVAALDRKTGKLLWKTFTLPEPKPFKKNAGGAQMFGPAGGAIWSAPTIDAKRNLLYVATGDSYTDIVKPGSDSIMAMDLDTGKVKWIKQVNDEDNFLMGCFGAKPAANCPSKGGPDFDFGASPILAKVKGKDVVFVGQKSGEVYAMDPDADGKILWQTRIGRGGALGGVEWGMAADAANLYVAVNQGGMPSLTALRLEDGAMIWQKRAPDPKCSYAGRCGNGYSSPPTLANGVLYGPNQDGHIRAFEAKTGKPVWDFDTAAQKYDTVNGVKNQRGGNLDGTGLAMAGGMGFIVAGFNGASSTSGPDNVVLAFSIDGK